MIGSSKRLRFRLALEFTIIAAVANALLFGVVTAVRVDQSRLIFDRELIQRARELGRQASRELDRGREGQMHLDVEDDSPIACEIFTTSGQLVAETSELQELNLANLKQAAIGSAAGGSDKGAEFATVEPDGAALRGPLRVVAVQIPASDDRPALTVYAAESLAPLNAALAELRWLLFGLVLPVSALAAGISGWLISDRVFRRIGQLTRAAHAMKPGELGQRLQVPQSRDEIGELAREMNQMLERLEAAFGAQRKFILDVTHELKTPVSILLSQAQLLAHKSPAVHGEQYEEFVSSVEEETRRLGQLLENFLTLARSAHGSTYVAESLVPINEVAAEAGARWEPVGRSLGSRVSLKLHYSDECANDAIIRGDHDLLVTMVENLLTAVSDLAGPKRLLEVLVDCEAGEARVLVRALDGETGSLVTSRAINERGHELRMAIVRGIAQLHGAEIQTAGAEVSVCFPVIQVSDRETIPA